MTHVGVIGPVEPPDDQLTVFGEQITFNHRERTFFAIVSKSNTTPSRFCRDYGGNNIKFQGETGRRWLVDPCTQALFESIQERRWSHAEEAKRERAIQKRLKGG